MKNSAMETLVGFLVIAIAAVFLLFGYRSTNKQPSHSVTYQALFECVDGISTNSEVKLGGVLVGAVSSIKIDESYQVLISIKVDSNIKIPNDSSLEVRTTGFIGDKYIEIFPGGSDEFLSNGDCFAYTKSSTSLESVVNKVVSAFVSKPEGQ
jgi:phospholipid/cholesterol/gamma-HCH transport system substrate-binding protein